MNKVELNGVTFDVLFRQAIIDSFMDELDSLPPDNELTLQYVYSSAHEERMKRRLFKKEELVVHLKIASTWLRKTVAVVVIVAALLFSGMMTIPQVRAMTLEVWVQWFEQFTKFISEVTDTNKSGEWRLFYTARYN